MAGRGPEDAGHIQRFVAGGDREAHVYAGVGEADGGEGYGYAAGL